MAWCLIYHASNSTFKLIQITPLPQECIILHDDEMCNLSRLTNPSISCRTVRDSLRAHQTCFPNRNRINLMNHTTKQLRWINDVIYEQLRNIYVISASRGIERVDHELLSNLQLRESKDSKDTIIHECCRVHIAMCRWPSAQVPCHSKRFGLRPAALKAGQMNGKESQNSAPDCRLWTSWDVLCCRVNLLKPSGNFTYDQV
jgi:hypothetical protein